MQRVRRFFTVFRFMGMFNLIYLISIGLIIWSAVAVIRVNKRSLDMAEMTLRELVYKTMEWNLLAQQTAVNRIVVLDSSPEYSALYDQIGQELNAILDNKIYQDLFASSEREQTLYENLRIHQSTHKQNYEILLAAHESGNEAQKNEAASLFENPSRLEEQLSESSYAARLQRELAQHALLLQTKRSVLVSLIGLILFPFLAFLAFVKASRITRPLLQLTSALIAIEGNAFQQDSLNDVNRRHDSLGEFGRSVSAMAENLDAQEKALEQEIVSLDQHLQRIRRQKMERKAGQ